MRRIPTPLFCGMSFFLVLPLLAAQPSQVNGEPLQILHDNSASQPACDWCGTKLKIVELEGELRQIDITHEVYPYVPGKPRPAIAIMGWELVVDGKSYRLDLGSRYMHRLAWELQGKLVRVTGRLEDRFRLDGIYDRSGVAIMTRPIYYQALVVTDLRAAPDFADVQIQGT